MLIPGVRTEWQQWFEMIDSNSSSNNCLLQPRYAESHLWLHSTLNFELDGLQQKTTPGATFINKQENEATFCTDSLKWDISRVETCCLVCDSQMIWLETGRKKIRIWIHFLVSVVQAAGGVMMVVEWGGFSWHIFGPTDSAFFFINTSVSQRCCWPFPSLYDDNVSHSVQKPGLQIRTLSLEV